MSNPVESGTKDWARQLIALYSDGCSDAEVAAELKITIKEYYRTITENPTFGKLVEFGRTLSQAFWEKQARTNLTNKQFNTPLWSFYMKNKFGWAEKSESVSQTENLNTNLDDLRERVNKEVARFVKKHTPELTDAQRVLMNLNTPEESDEQ
jgi:hypothetical protein